MLIYPVQFQEVFGEYGNGNKVKGKCPAWLERISFLRNVTETYNAPNSLQVLRNQLERLADSGEQNAQ